MHALQIVGVVAAVAAMGLLLGLSCLAYFKARKRWAHVKYMLEFVFIGFSILLSIAVKLVVFCVLSESKDFAGGFGACIKAVYSGIGGLTFEGLESFESDTVGIILQCCYFASSLYAGVMMLFIISAKASYEFFTRMSLFFMGWFGVRNKKDVFVITAVTEEGLYLAKDIRENFPGAVIIFASPSIEPFDRQNEICRQIMANGFLYWSYAKKEDVVRRGKSCPPASIAKTVNLNNDNAGRYSRRFIIYAFASENHIPMEEENLDLVFEDVSARIERSDNLRIEYYMLTKREINYQAYNYRNREMMLRYAQKRAPSFSEEQQKLLNGEDFTRAFLKMECRGELSKLERAIKNMYAERFVLNVWCEALAIGRQAVKTMAAAGFADRLASTDDPLRVWAFGFGATGLAVSNELFVQSAGVGDDGSSRGYMLDVFDGDAYNKGGLFKQEHAGSLCLYDEQVEVSPLASALLPALKECAGGEGEAYAALLRYVKNTYLPAKECARYVEERAISKGMPTPLYVFHRVDCTDLRFYERVDGAYGPSSKGVYSAAAPILAKLGGSSSKEVRELAAHLKAGAAHGAALMPETSDAVIVSTGDDFRNVRIANTIIKDVSDGVRHFEKRPYILVNVWDPHNNALLLNGGGIWNEGHTVCESENLVIIVVGNNDRIYTFEATAQQQSEERYNVTYSNGYDLLNSNSQVKDGDGEIIDWNWLAHELKCGKVSNPRADKWLSLMENFFKERYAVVYGGKKSEKPMAGVSGDLIKIFNADAENAAKKYCSIDIWKRESNKSATLYADFHRAKYAYMRSASDKADYLKIYSRLSEMEHERWVRMHMANGWVYSPVKNEMLRHHNCIIPLNDLEDITVLYDTLNAFWAIARQI